MVDTALAALVLCLGAVCVLGVLSHRVTQTLRLPAPALFLVAAALAGGATDRLGPPSTETVARVVTAALVVVLFDGGLHIGAARMRRVLWPVLLTGVLGTFATAAVTAVVAHLVLGLPAYLSLLVATALAPTDPAVVFSVLGQREVGGRSGTVLEGESGANDPVGIALMASLLAAGGLSVGSLSRVVGELVLQGAVGLVLGVAGGRAVLLLSRRVALPAEGCTPLRTLGCAFALYGVTTLAHGSGLLAVFVAGIVLGDERAPYKREVERFHSALASLAELVVFAVLGLTVDLAQLARTDVWVPGLVLGAALALVVRPLCLGPLLLPARLDRGEVGFVLFAGLKGAVPVLLGGALLSAHVPQAERLYAVVVVVVVFSVVAQGTLVPTVARVLGVPMRSVPDEPFALGVRLRSEPEGVRRYVVAEGSPAVGRVVAALPEQAWVSLVVRRGDLLAVRGETVLVEGDEVVVLVEPRDEAVVAAAFAPR